MTAPVKSYLHLQPRLCIESRIMKSSVAISPTTEIYATTDPEER